MTPYDAVLVVQASVPLEPMVVAELAGMAGAEHKSWINPMAVRLSPADATRFDEIQAHAEAVGYDVAIVAAERPLNSFGLIVSDMDSTLITIECIDEIAAALGIKDKVSAITERAMQGELDFAASLTERVALLAGTPESALERVYKERLELTEGARDLLDACKANGVKFMLVSGGFTFFTEKLKAELGLDYAHANVLEVADGKLTGKVSGPIVDATTKAELLIKVRDELNLLPDQVIAMGDGANDLLMLAEAGVGVAFRAKPKVRAQADVALNHVGLDGLLNLFPAE